jgi:hypothetical protein
MTARSDAVSRPVGVFRNWRRRSSPRPDGGCTSLEGERPSDRPIQRAITADTAPCAPSLMQPFAWPCHLLAGSLSAAPSRLLALAPPAGVFGVPALGSRAGGVIEEEVTCSPFATMQTRWLQVAELKDEDTSELSDRRCVVPLKLRVQATFVSNKSNPCGAFIGQPIERLRLGQAALEQCFA